MVVMRVRVVRVGGGWQSHASLNFNQVRRGRWVMNISLTNWTAWSQALGGGRGPVRSLSVQATADLMTHLWLRVTLGSIPVFEHM